MVAATNAATAPGSANAAPPAAQAVTVSEAAEAIRIRGASVTSVPATNRVIRTAAVRVGLARLAPAPNRPTTAAPMAWATAARPVRAESPMTPMPIAVITIGQGAVAQPRPNEAGTASAVSAAPATANSRRISVGRASTAAMVSRNAAPASCQVVGPTAAANSAGYRLRSGFQAGSAARTGATPARSAPPATTRPLTVSATAEANCGPRRAASGTARTASPVTVMTAAISSSARPGSATEAIRLSEPITARVTMPAATSGSGGRRSTNAPASPIMAASSSTTPAPVAVGTVWARSRAVTAYARETATARACSNQVSSRRPGTGRVGRGSVAPALASISSAASSGSPSGRLSASRWRGADGVPGDGRSCRTGRSTVTPERARPRSTSGRPPRRRRPNGH